MEDIRSLLSLYRARSGKDTPAAAQKLVEPEVATTSEIPDVFFDEILPVVKLSRTETALLMTLYRQVWCRPNLYRSHGIGPLNSYQELSRLLHVGQEDVINALRVLENLGFIQAIRSGQFFVRKFFTEENDTRFGQSYEF